MVIYSNVKVFYGILRKKYRMKLKVLMNSICFLIKSQKLKRSYKKLATIKIKRYVNLLV